MDEETYIYSSETLISPHTNRPVDAVKRNPIFWCEICHLRLKSAHTAISHLGGRQHRARISVKDNLANENNQNDTLKRKLVVDSSNVKQVGPATKKIKEQPANPATKKSEVQPAKAAESDPNLKCEDCNLVFASAMMAIQHFKGKRHASAMAKKLESKQSQTISRWQGRGPATEGQRGRGRGGRGRGRGDGFSRGGGFSRGAAAGQLIRALKNFYGQPSDNSLSVPGHSWINPSGNIQHNEPRSSFDVGRNDFYGNARPSNYGTPQQLNVDRPGQSKEYFTSTVGSQQFSGGSSNDMYDNNNQYNAPPSTMGSSFSGGSDNYYSRDYWRQ